MVTPMHIVPIDARRAGGVWGGYPHSDASQATPQPSHGWPESDLPFQGVAM